MGELVDKLGKKTPGQLIKSEDWNSLVAAVETIQTTLGQRIDALSTSVDQRFQQVNQRVGDLKTGLDLAITNLTSRVTKLETDFNAFRPPIEESLRLFWRVTLETTRTNYALGELAEITARITDLQGRAVTTRPWIDFVSTWGQFSVVAGFESLGGEGNRSISVRTDAGGVARIRLRSEYAGHLADEVHAEVATALTANVQAANTTFANLIFNANTPVEAKTAGAFKLMSKEYDRTDTRHMRNYIDSYYVTNAHRVSNSFRPVESARLGWHDYRTTIIAFVKADNDPRTPDAARGTSSTQITFRDWIRSWLDLDYMKVDEAPAVIDNLIERFKPKITADFRGTVESLKQGVRDVVSDRGLVGRQKDYLVIDRAFDRLTVSQAPPFMNTVTKSMRDAVRMQQVMENTQTATLGLSTQDVAFDVFTNNTARTDTGFAGVTAGVDNLQKEVARLDKEFSTLATQTTQQTKDVSVKLAGLEVIATTAKNDVTRTSKTVEGIQAQFATVNQSVGLLNGRVETALSESGTLGILRANVEKVSNTVQRLDALDIPSVTQRIAEIPTLSARLDKANLNIGALQSQVRKP